VALDDFGTGYSSLGHLTRLPLDVVKLDRSFVRDVEGDARAAGVIGAVIGMAQGLGLRVVAEGVDAPEQARVLRALGCDELQGFLVSPALPPDEAVRFLRGAPSPRSTRRAARAARAPRRRPGCSRGWGRRTAEAPSSSSSSSARRPPRAT
jgi:EAL domain-containing protein (putative c-di-GMP-specific phosphodiesterase class I)